jgi:hypothetical protein
VTHWPFIAAAYVIAVAVPLGFSVEVFFRVRSAHRRLRAVDPRASRGRA